MTATQLQRANEVQHQIKELDNMIQITESFLHSDTDLWISNHNDGEVKVSPEARLDIINTVLSDLREQQSNLEEEFKSL